MKFFKDTHRFLSTFFLSYLLLVSQVFAQGSFTNPLEKGGINKIPDFIATALKIMVEVALPVTTLFFVYSGFLFIKAQGKPTELTTAKKNFVYVVIGALLILGAWVIATMIGGTVSQIVGN